MGACRVKSAPMSEEDQRTYNVAGMTCEHCAASVDAQVSGLTGVSAVSVDLASGALVVQGDIDGEAVRAAVQAAGYDLAGHS
jgi:copper chaperone